ncbi:MAG: hypothetical protein EZS28_011741 [Streblomastix strix]|uniref:Uncharacterized protein n=1 Tax=Streblomastix strix TaxID=222440 RepID=A0A5J4WCV0_9EUKA|nr:MAG: hypothetical protein EZS28_011741 [Streblomastix strix]
MLDTIACRVNAFTSDYVAPAALNLVFIAWRIVGPVYINFIPDLLMIAVNWWLHYSELADECFINFLNILTEQQTLLPSSNLIVRMITCFPLEVWVLSDKECISSIISDYFVNTNSVICTAKKATIIAIEVSSYVKKESAPH